MRCLNNNNVLARARVFLFSASSPNVYDFSLCFFIYIIPIKHFKNISLLHTNEKCTFKYIRYSLNFLG